MKSYNVHSPSYSISFAVKNLAYNKSILGLELGVEGLNYGYRAITIPGALLNGGRASTGMYKPMTKILIYKLAPIIGYEFDLEKNLQLRTTLHPTLFYYPFSGSLNKTHNAITAQSMSDLWLVMHPAQQNEGLHFLAKVQVSLAYSLTNRFSTFLSIAYQQGFNNFLIDNTQIYLPQYPNLDNRIYQTEVNGTSIQGHIGLRYNLNR